MTELVFILGAVVVAQVGVVGYVVYLLHRQHDRTETRILASDRVMQRDPLKKREPKASDGPEDMRRRQLAARRHAEEAYFGDV
jgi:hypothetical protein